MFSSSHFILPDERLSHTSSPRTLAHFDFRNYTFSSKPTHNSALNTSQQASITPKPHTNSSDIASDTNSITLSVPKLGKRRARALCNHLKPILGAKSVQYHDVGALEIAWPTPSNACSDLKELGDPSLGDATSQHDRVGRTSDDDQPNRVGSLDHSESDKNKIDYGKKACALRVHNDLTGGESCHTLRQDWRGKWSATSGAIGFRQKDNKTLRVEDGENITTFLPGKVRTVVGRHGKWRTTSTVSPASHPFARS